LSEITIYLFLIFFSFADEFDEEAFANSGNDDAAKEDSFPKRKRKSDESDPLSSLRKRGKKAVGGDLQSLLASAEEFSALIEQSEEGKDGGSSEAVSTLKDRAGAKQIMWEKDQRKKDHWKKGGKKKNFEKRDTSKTTKR
jgi:hypothetical protein